MKKIYACNWCGKNFERLECCMKGKKHAFCSRQCLAAFSNKSKNPVGYLSLKSYDKMAANFSELAKKLNPVRMTPEVKQKIRETRIRKYDGKSYSKYFGRHMHRVVAEQILDRPLKPGEVVHHIDGNPRNNAPNNLFVFASQKEHAQHHAFLKYVLGGDAE